MNIRLEYLYRDASNYKRWAEVVFENPQALSAAEVMETLGDATKRWRLFADVLHFRPERVGLPTCYLTEIGYPESEDDMDLHEVHRVVATEQPCTDRRTIERFLADLGASRGSPR
jgi:hypothetical protein